MLPVWAMAGRRVRASLGTRQVPMLALGAAFCFTIMMFNIPALGGTTAHPVAGTLLAVLVGPWAAVIGVSVALAIQALFFGDGGLLAYGANCFTMAFVLPFVGYSVYRLTTARLAARSPMRAVCAGLGAYAGLNAASAIVAVLLGIQPALFHEPNGHALYFPFGLNVTLPAMLGTHLLVAGPAEAVVTTLVVRYAQQVGLPLYGVSESDIRERIVQRRETLWIGLLALVALSPLGLLAKGEAWGEWDAQGLAEQIKRTQGIEYVPKGVAASEEHGYKGVQGLEDYASEKGAKGYIGAGLLGVGAIVTLLLLGGRALARPDKRERQNDAIPLPGSSARTEAVTAAPSGSGIPLPEWMRRPAEEIEVTDSSRKSNPYLARTLSEMASGAATTLGGETWARRSGYLQRLDARAKLWGLVGLIAVVACLHSIGALLTLYALTLALAVVSHLPVGMLVRRVWLSVPIFVGALALPAVLNIVTPGHPLLTLWHRPYLAVTTPGLTVAGLLILRVGVAVSLATLLTLTTGWNDLLRALRAFGTPRLFVSVLAMTYRYLIVSMQTASEMFVARRSRTVGRATNAEGRRFVGTSVGALFGKTLALSEEVHAAMVSRGFQGDMPSLTASRWRVADSLWTVSLLLIAVVTLGGEYALRGR